MGLGGAQEAVGRVPSGRTPAAERRPPPRPAPATRDRLFAAGLAALPATAVVLFGAVEDEHALPLMAGALAAGAAAVVARARRGARPLPVPGVTVPVLLLATIPALQLAPLPLGIPALLSPGLRRFGATALPALSLDPDATAVALLRWLGYAAFLVAALEVLRRPGAVSSALAVVGVLGVLEAVYGIGNLLLGNHHLLWLPRDPSEDATGTLVNRNHYAALFELCLPALLAHRWLSRSRGPDERGLAALYLTAATAMGLAVLLSRSRAGIACLTGGLTLTFILVPADAAGRRARRMLGVLVLLVLAYGASAGLRPVMDRFQDLPDAGTQVRPALWRDTLDLIADFPILGTGAGSYGGTLPPYRRRLTAQASFAHAHQDLLELAAEGGLLAVALALVAGAGFARAIAAGLRRVRERTRLGMAALLGGIAALLLHAMADFPLHIPGLSLLLVLLAAATLALAGPPERSEPG